MIQLPLALKCRFPDLCPETRVCIFVLFFDVRSSEKISHLDIFPKAQTQAKTETYVNKADKRHYKAQGISV